MVEGEEERARGRWGEERLRRKRGNKGEEEAEEIKGGLVYLPLGEVSQAGHSGETGEDPGQLSMLRYLPQAHRHRVWTTLGPCYNTLNQKHKETH